jgi:hypothetical protein
VYNITDGSWTTITAVSGDRTTITGVLAGGTDNDWDTNDYYMLMPPTGKHESQYPWATETIHVIRTPVGCTSMECRLINNSTGVIGLHQFEVQPSLNAGGDFEAAGAGNPWIPTDWANCPGALALDAGDSETEATIVHAGAQSMQFNVGASVQGIRQQITAAAGAFVRVGIWSYGDGSAGFTIGGLDATQLCLQGAPATFNVATPHTAVWSHTSAVFRVVAANPYLYILADAGAAAERYIDDVSMTLETPITLTVTPASAVNSAEGTGIRVDGTDARAQTEDVGKLKPTKGRIDFCITPRHADATMRSFGNLSPYILAIEGPGGQYIRVYWSAANTITLAYHNGTAPFTGTYATGGTLFAAATKVTARVQYNSGAVWLEIAGRRVLTVVGATGFPQPFTTWWQGSDSAGAQQIDAVFSAA